MGPERERVSGELCEGLCNSNSNNDDEEQWLKWPTKLASVAIESSGSSLIFFVISLASGAGLFCRSCACSHSRPFDADVKMSQHTNKLTSSLGCLQVDKTSTRFVDIPTGTPRWQQGQSPRQFIIGTIAARAPKVCLITIIVIIIIIIMIILLLEWPANFADLQESRG